MQDMKEEFNNSKKKSNFGTEKLNKSNLEKL
jgi:hypothetical protein